MKTKMVALIAFISIAMVSCSIGDDDVLSLNLEVVAVTDVEIPDPFVFGEVNEIIVKYNNPSDCHRFYAFDVRPDLNVREVTIVTDVFDGTACVVENVPTEQILRFIPTSNGTVKFKFFSGFDLNGDKEFLEIEVDVQE
jgi:hypothetical protein